MNHRQQGQGLYIPIPGLPGGGGGFPGGGYPGGGYPGGGQLDRLERQIQRLNNQLDRLERRVDRIERRLGLRQEDQHFYY
ncbi:hypothetical protein G3A_19350 [Bacillus sp. 17376]|nr:hypothetical protein G3A_19350 [Bacillus sp. 17376]